MNSQLEKCLSSFLVVDDLDKIFSELLLTLFSNAAIKRVSQVIQNMCKSWNKKLNLFLLLNVLEHAEFDIFACAH